MRRIKKMEIKSVKDREKYLRGLVAVGKLDSKLCEVLIQKGIATCPASVRYHGAYEGGLFDHCKAMYEALDEMTTRLGLKWKSPRSVGNVAWAHDMCKLDNYTKVVDEPSKTGKLDYESKEGSDEFVIPEKYHYEYNKDSGLVGHGVKSAILSQQATPFLTEEEIYCIVFHMGAYEKDQWAEYDKAIKKYPNVLFTHTADMCAAKIMGV